jgi:hypothetical protein
VVGPRLRIAALLLFLVAFTIAAPPDGVVPAFARARAGSLTVGIHAPNRPWREQDFALVGIGEFGGVKMMSYHAPEVYHRLRQYAPQMKFVVRLNTGWHELPAPEQFAARNTPYLRALVDSGIEPWVEIGNEPNLELHPYAEETFAAWYLQTLEHLRTSVPEARYGFPGLAQDLREMEWLDANAQAIRGSDWLGVHAYWTDEREMLDPRRGLKILEYHRRFPEKPLLVTEAGNTEYNLSREEKGRQYARFTRTLARLPYVHGVYYFILYGTREWSRFFFDDGMALAVRAAASDPIPPLAQLLGVRPPPPKRWVIEGESDAAAASKAPEPTPTPRPRLEPTPTPEGFRRRQFLADGDPAALARATAGAADRWLHLPPAPAPAAELRTTNGYTATDISVLLTVALPSPGVPFALQIAEADLFAAPGGTGFALLWDGEQWRLQYRRSGSLFVDKPLSSAPRGFDLTTTAAGNSEEAAPSSYWASDQSPIDEWLAIEVALEPRSAAAWIWWRSEPQPDQPNAVFAPPEEASLDGARLRALFLPAHPVANVVLQGATRYW